MNDHWSDHLINGAVSDDDLNTEPVFDLNFLPFENQTATDHLNSELVWY